MKEKRLKKRRAARPMVRDEVLREAGYKCGNAACHNIITLQLHHMIPVKDDGPNTATNLIPLCGYCHDQHTHGHIPPDAIRHWKGLLVALNHAFNKESMDRLLDLNHRGMGPVWYSGDGLLKFAGLIAAGLVEKAGHVNSVKPSTTAVTVKLSDRGRLLVDSWLKGDEEQYKAALASPSGPGSPSTTK